MVEHKINFENNVTSRVIKFEKKEPRLTQNQVDEIRKIWETDFSVQQKDLAEKFNMRRSEISSIVNNKMYISDTYVPIKNRPKFCKTIRKLSDEDVKEIRRLHFEDKLTYKEISCQFVCSSSYVKQICKNIYRREIVNKEEENYENYEDEIKEEENYENDEDEIKEDNKKYNVENEYIFE